MSHEDNGSTASVSAAMAALLDRIKELTQENETLRTGQDIPRNLPIGYYFAKADQYLAENPSIYEGLETEVLQADLLGLLRSIQQNAPEKDAWTYWFTSEFTPSGLEKKMRSLIRDKKSGPKEIRAQEVVQALKQVGLWGNLA